MIRKIEIGMNGKPVEFLIPQTDADLKELARLNASTNNSFGDWKPVANENVKSNLQLIVPTGAQPQSQPTEDAALIVRSFGVKNFAQLVKKQIVDKKGKLTSVYVTSDVKKLESQHLVSIKDLTKESATKYLDDLRDELFRYKGNDIQKDACEICISALADVKSPYFNKRYSYARVMTDRRGKMLGAVAAVEHERDFEINYLGVHPDHVHAAQSNAQRIKGIGSRLLKEVMVKACNAKVDIVLSSYKRAVPFYKSMGFVAVDNDEENLRFVMPYETIKQRLEEEEKAEKSISKKKEQDLLDRMIELEEALGVTPMATLNIEVQR